MIMSKKAGQEARPTRSAGTRRTESLSPLEAQAGAAQVDFVFGAEFFAAAVTTGDFDGAAVAEDARAVFALVVADAILAGLQADAAGRHPPTPRGVPLV
jgi:hypothetical protein